MLRLPLQMQTCKDWIFDQSLSVFLGGAQMGLGEFPFFIPEGSQKNGKVQLINLKRNGRPVLNI